MTDVQPYPVTIEAAFDEIERLRRIEQLVKAWARAHRAHHPATTMGQADPPGYVDRATFLEAQRALLEAVRT